MDVFLKLTRNIYAQSLVFWVVSFFILHSWFTVDYDNGWPDILFTILFHLPLIIIVSLNYFFTQKFIPLKYYLRYLLSFIGLVFIGLILYRYGFEIITDWIAPTYYLTLFYSNIELIQIIISYLIISLLLFLTRKWFIIKEKQTSLEKENYNAKLSLLKAQLNPHFLFNSLNNIYSLAKDNPEARDYLMKLGDSLRYMTYETDEDRVLLENEIKYIENYISLEKLRLDNSNNINFSVNGDIQGYLIAPLIFLPFVENCFKHVDREHPYIEISINITNDVLEFTSLNNFEHNNKLIGGLGIENIKKRLDLIYKNNYKLIINDKVKNYHISLFINL